MLFGGTFDPIHKGHIEPVTQACQKIGAEQLIFIPCHIPPHKQTPTVTSQDRFNMVQLVANELDARLPFTVSCSDHELRQQGHSYTRLTVEYFSQEMADDELYFFIGMDSYLNFVHWHQWSQILDFCQLLVAQRPGYTHTTSLPEKLVERSKLIDLPQYDISSTSIRNDIGNAISNDWLPTSVTHYIEKNNLYFT